MGNSIGWLLSFILLMSLLGSVYGYQYFGNTKGMAGGGIVGIIAALWVGISKLARLMHPDSYTEYAYEEPATKTVEHVTLVIVVNDTRKLVHGFTRDELRLIGDCVTDGYIFNVQHFKDYFKGTEFDGYSLYNKSVRWMQDCKALAPNSKGGYDVGRWNISYCWTWKAGKNFIP